MALYFINESNKSAQLMQTAGIQVTAKNTNLENLEISFLNGGKCESLARRCFLVFIAAAYKMKPVAKIRFKLFYLC